MNKLLYITSIKYPTSLANGLQVREMCIAFRKLGIDVNLLSRGKPENSGVLNQVQVDDSIMYPRAFFLALNIKKIIDSEYKNATYYTREPLLSFWLALVSRTFRNNFYFEVHSLARQSKLVYKFIFKYTKGVISTTQNKVDDLIKYGINKERICVEPNGAPDNFLSISIDRNSSRGELNLPANKKIVLYLGSFTRNKGVYTIADFINSREVNDYYFLFVGGTVKDMESLRSYIKRNADLRGHIEHSDVPKYISAADVVLVAPSPKYDIKMLYKYGSPIKIPEYMALRRPVVAAKVPAVLEWLDKENSYLFEPDDEVSLGNMIDEAFANPGTTEEKVKKAREKVENHTWEKRAARILSVINK